MKASEWVEAVLAAAALIAEEADRHEPPAATADALGRVLVLLGRAAGHADRLCLDGPVGARGRHHFQAEAVQAGATALTLLGQGRPERSSREIAEGILFQEGDIVEHGEQAEEEATEEEAARGAPLAGGESLGIGGLRGGDR